MPDITGALERLHQDDPATGLSPLSATERDAIRDRIVAGDPTHQATQPLRPRQRRWGTTVRHGRLLAVAAVLTVGGGVAAAAILDQGTTTLVAHGLSCISGTNNNAAVDAYDVPQNGDSPTAACAPVIGVPATSLVACAKPDAGVIVYEADSDSASQCRSLGLASLPTDYTAAITQIHALEQALTADYNKSDCTPPNQLAQDANADLQRLGFIGWRAAIDTSSAVGAEFAGPCGEFPAAGASISTATAALEASNHTVMIEIGAPRSILQLAESTTEPIINASGDQCYTLAGAQQLVRDMLNKAAGRTVPVKFAVTREAANTTAMGGLGGDGRQTYYDQGCTIVASLGTAPDGQTFMVLLQNSDGSPADNTGSSAHPLSPWGAPASAFQSDLTNG